MKRKQVLALLMAVAMTANMQRRVRGRGKGRDSICIYGRERQTEEHDRFQLAQKQERRGKTL